MDAGNFEEEPADRTSSDLAVVPDLEGVGLSRPHSVPVVKIATHTTSQNSLSDVIKNPIHDVIKTPLDIIKTTTNDVIKTEINVIKTEILKTSLQDVIKTTPLNNSIHNKEATHQVISCSPSVESTVTTNLVSPQVDTERQVSSYDVVDPDWREAAKAPTLMVRCKKTTGELVKSKFGSGSKGKSIRLGEEWYTPTEFEAHCGRSASKDWKRSIRFRCQRLLSLVEEGFLQIHATSCSCGICLDDEEAAGPIRLHRQYKRKKRDKIYLNTADLTAKVLKRSVSEGASAETPTTVTLPMSDFGDLTVVPGLIIGDGTSLATPQGATITTNTAVTVQPSTAPDCTSSTEDLASLPLDKAWGRMNKVLMDLEQSVSSARVLLNGLKARTDQEVNEIRQKLLAEKEEAINQAKLEAQFSNMAKSSEGFLVQVRDDDNGQSLQPIMLDSLISNVPALSQAPAPLTNSVRKKCVNCNRESELECSGCRNKAYCGDFCQRRDWVNHQSECARSSPPPEDTLNNVPQVPGYIFMLSD